MMVASTFEWASFRGGTEVSSVMVVEPLHSTIDDRWDEADSIRYAGQGYFCVFDNLNP